jgi:hypothetical protein
VPALALTLLLLSTPPLLLMLLVMLGAAGAPAVTVTPLLVETVGLVRSAAVGPVSNFYKTFFSSSWMYPVGYLRTLLHY